MDLHLKGRAHRRQVERSKEFAPAPDASPSASSSSNTGGSNSSVTWYCSTLFACYLGKKPGVSNFVAYTARCELCKVDTPGGGNAMEIHKMGKKHLRKAKMIATKM